MIAGTVLAVPVAVARRPQGGQQARRQEGVIDPKAVPFVTVPAVLTAARMETPPRFVPSSIRHIVEIMAVVEHATGFVDMVLPGIEIAGEQVPRTR